MSDQPRPEKRPMWNSSKAWALVLGGMLAIGGVNLWLGFRSVPEGFDQNWRWADAAVPDAAPTAAPAPPADAGITAPADAQSK